MLTDEKQLFGQELLLLGEASRALEYSYKICNEIGIKEEYTLEELDRFEALTSRFARTSDIITQKIFRLIDILELEGSGTVIDRINRAERRDLISSANVFKQIRSIRNQISHEYLPELIREIFKEVLNFTPELLETIDRIKKYEIRD